MQNETQDIINSNNNAKNGLENDALFLEKAWYAVKTRSKHEKLSSSLIATKNIEIYLPVKKTMQEWSDRKKLITFPLFPGYFFVNMPLTQKSLILNTKGVVKILGTPAAEAIPSEQIDTLKFFESHEVEVDPFLNLLNGDYVKVIKGPLKGCFGYLIKKKTKYRLFVNLKVLMQSVSVEIDASSVIKA